MATVSVSMRGDKEVEQLLDSLSGRELGNRTRRATRAGVAVFRTALRAKAGDAQYPRSYRKIATKNHRDGSTSVGPTSPLWNIFEGGATTHTIAPRRSPILTNQGWRRSEAEAHGEAIFASRKPVWHPGVAAIPFTTPVFEAEHDDAAEAAMAKLVEGLR